MSKYGFLNSYAKNTVGISYGRSKFNLSHHHQTTFQSGCWFPAHIVEVLPGDTFEVNLSALVKELTPVAPTMTDIIMEVAAFWVPNRLCCKGEHDWEDICMGAEPDAWSKGFDKDIISTGNYVPPYGWTVQAAPVNSLANYMGIPNGKNAGVTDPNKTGYYQKLSALPFNAVIRIWNEWLRDENLANSIDLINKDTDDGTIIKLLTGSMNAVFPAYRIKDYFTSALPAPQKGPAVNVPIVGSAPVITGEVNPDITAPTSTTEGMKFATNIPGTATNTEARIAGSGTDATLIGFDGDATGQGTAYAMAPNNLYADLANATGASVNAIRMSFAIQRLQEKLARGGSRYNEYLKAVFGVNAPTGLLNMSEYIGGGSIPINITTVLQTSSTNDVSPLGTQGAFSSTFTDKIKFKKSFVEYGFMVVMATVRPISAYCQGLPLMFRRYSPLDMFQPTFAFIGEQPIYKEELYYSKKTAKYDPTNGNENENAPIWGYKPAWEEYRNIPTRVSGALAPTAGDATLAPWTANPLFATEPTLSEEFMRQDKSQIGNTLIDTNTATQFIGDFVAEIIATRTLPVESIPGMLDHF